MGQEEPSQLEAMEERAASKELTTTKAIFIMSQCDVEYKTLTGINKFIIMALSQKQRKWNKQKKKSRLKKKNKNSIWTVKSNKTAATCYRPSYQWFKPLVELQEQGVIKHEGPLCADKQKVPTESQGWDSQLPLLKISLIMLPSTHGKGT